MIINELLSKLNLIFVLKLYIWKIKINFQKFLKIF